MTLRQAGDSEGTLSFDASNKEQARFALKIAGARQKRQITPEQRARLIAAGSGTLFATAQEGPFTS